MNVRNCAAKLSLAAKDLKFNWEQTEVYWRDVKSAEFADKYVNSIPDRVARARAVIEELDLLIKKVRSDCE